MTRCAKTNYAKSTINALIILLLAFYCLRLGLDIGRSYYEGKEIACVKEKRGFYCTIEVQR